MLVSQFVTVPALLVLVFVPLTRADWASCEAGLDVCDCNQDILQVTCADVSFNTLTNNMDFPNDTRRIIFRSNSLTALTEGYFEQIGTPELEVLEFFSNALSSTFTRASFRGIPNLHTLRVDGSTRTSLVGDLLADLRNLETFAWTSGRITAMPECIFYGLEHLTHFEWDMNVASVNSLPRRMLFSPSQTIQSFYIGESNVFSFDGIPNRFFDSSPTLEDIHFLGFPTVTTIPAENCFRDVPAVKKISFTNTTQLTGIELGAFDQVPSVELIELYSNGLILDGVPVGLFDEVAPVTVDLRDNPTLTSLPRACDTEGVMCLYP